MVRRIRSGALAPLCALLASGCPQGSKPVGEFTDSNASAGATGDSATETGGDATTGATTDATMETSTDATMETSTEDSTSSASETASTGPAPGPPLEVDPVALELYPDRCVPAGSGVDIAQLIADGVVVGGDGSSITCAVEPDAPGHGALPQGITVAADCLATGVVAPTLPLGAYAWIVTLTQESTDERVYLPYCAAQSAPHPGAYGVTVTRGGDDVTTTPGYATLTDGVVDYGGAPDELTVAVLRPCEHLSCFYSYYFAAAPVSPGAVTGAPSEIVGPEYAGFQHSLTVSSATVDDALHDRYFVLTTRWDYCMYGSDSADAQAENAAVCGSKALAQRNGDDSNLEHDVIVRPP